MVRDFSQAEPLFLGVEEASRLVEAARRGRIPTSAGLLRARSTLLVKLEDRFPGLDAKRAVAQEPRLLGCSSDKLLEALLRFQDGWPLQPVGPLVGRLGWLIYQAHTTGCCGPLGLAGSLRALQQALKHELGMPFSVRQLSGTCTFLLEAQEEVRSRVAAAATIFGRTGGVGVLLHHLTVLNYEPRDLNARVLLLREVMALPHPDPALDRKYVTDLVVRCPEVLGLAGPGSREALEAMMAAVRRLRKRQVRDLREGAAAAEGAAPAPGAEEQEAADKQGAGRLRYQRRDLLAMVLQDPGLLWSCSGLPLLHSMRTGGKAQAARAGAGSTPGPQAAQEPPASSEEQEEGKR